MQHPLASVTMAGLVLCEAALRLRGGEGLDAANHFVVGNHSKKPNHTRLESEFWGFVQLYLGINTSYRLKRQTK